MGLIPDAAEMLWLNVGINLGGCDTGNARRFLTSYIKRMESASEKLMTNASRCMNTKI